MHSEFRHAYLQYVGIRVGGTAIAVDYQSTVYWGRVIAISQTGIVTLRSYGGVEKGHKTKDFHPYRCIGDPYTDEHEPPNGHLHTRYSVLEHFKHYIIPKLKAFPEYYAEIEALNAIVYCQHCSYDEDSCNCQYCEDCGLNTYDCGCDPDYANDPYDEDVTLDDILDEDEYHDDTDGNTVSWLCATCGDPAYDCGCDESIQDQEERIDRLAELMEVGRI